MDVRLRGAAGLVAEADNLQWSAVGLVREVRVGWTGDGRPAVHDGGGQLGAVRASVQHCDRGCGESGRQSSRG